jgi:hypothetical protein
MSTEQQNNRNDFRRPKARAQMPKGMIIMMMKPNSAYKAKDTERKERNTKEKKKVGR